MHLRSISLGLGVIVLLALSVGLMSGRNIPFLTSRPAPTKGGSVAEGLERNAIVLNPLFAEDDSSRDVDALIYQGLTTIGPSQEVEPLLAQSWSLSDDGLKYTFVLRTDVKWADGQPLTVADVLYTFKVLQDPGYTQAAAAIWRDVQVSAAGDNGVSFTLKAPSSSFPLLLSMSAPDSFGILPEHIFHSTIPKMVANDPHSWARALGTGPFSVASISSDSTTITLKRNPHARPAPYLDTFVFQSYPTVEDAVKAERNGEVDTVGGLQLHDVRDLQHQPNITVKDIKTNEVVTLLFNLDPTQAAPLDNQSVREALVQGVNRAQVIATALGGLADPAPGPIPPANWAYSTAAAKYGYDPIAAGKTLDSAGWVLPSPGAIRMKDGKPFHLTLVTADLQPYATVADVVALELRHIGVDVVVDKEPADHLLSDFLIGRHYQMALAAIENGPDPDQYSLWHSGEGADGLDLAHLPRQPFVDKDLEDGRATTVRSDRFAAYADFQTLLADMAPAIFLYEPHYEYAISSRLRGVKTDRVIQPKDRFLYVTQWYVGTGQF